VAEFNHARVCSSEAQILFLLVLLETHSAIQIHLQNHKFYSALPVIYSQYIHILLLFVNLLYTHEVWDLIIFFLLPAHIYIVYYNFRSEKKTPNNYSRC
jgi:hypothetical protein